MNKLKKFSNMLAGVVAAVYVSGVLAAPATIEEVLVTAQKREQSLQDVPLSVQVLGSDQLKQNRVTDLADISVLTPNLYISGNGEVAIRGVSTLVVGSGFDDSSPTYLDGIYLDNSLILSELYDVDRIEVLRGPQGTLFGRNASAGAINVASVAPTDTLEGSIVLGYGTEDEKVFRGVLNAPLSDGLRLRLSGTKRERDGWIDSVNSDDEFGDIDHTAFRGRLAWDLSQSVTADFSADYYDEDDLTPIAAVLRGSELEGFGGVIFPTGDLDDTSLPTSRNPATGVPLASGSDSDSYGVSASFNFELTDTLSLLSATSYRKTDLSVSVDSVGSVSPDDAIASIALLTDREPETFNQEFRLSQVTDSVDWFVGFNYYKQETKSLETVTATEGDLGFPLTSTTGDASGNTVDVDSFAIFSDAVFFMSDKLSLTVGLRYSYDEKEIRWDDTVSVAPANSIHAPVIDGEFYLVDLPPSLGGTGEILFPLYDARVDENWDNVSGRLVLDYNLNDSTLLYGSVSTGYKSGGFNTLPAVGQDPDDPVDEETAINYEVGTKGTWFDDRLRLNGAVFFTDYDDFQTQATSPGQFAAVNVTADADIYGAELDALWLVNDALAFTVAAGYLDAEYTEQADAGGLPALEEGQELVGAPEYSASISGDYRLLLDDVGSLRFNVTYSYRDGHRLINDPVNTLNAAVASSDSSFRFVDADVRTKSYEVLNARATYTSVSEQWSLSVWGTNLLDETYRSDPSAMLGNSLLNFTGRALVTYGRNEPRMAGLEFSYNF